MDVDVGWWPGGGRLARIGPKRSPIHDPGRAARLAAEIAARPGTRLAGLMAYEGHIAGVGDELPGRPLRSAAIRRMQSASEREIRERLPKIVAAVREATPGGLEFVNGGGTGSLARTAAAGIATELTAGSGFYAPHLFDNYRSLDLTPRRSSCCRSSAGPRPGRSPRSAAATSPPAPAAPGRCPQPYLPAGLRLDGQEGAGEVQTPLVGMAARGLRIGDRVYMRHAKAGRAVRALRLALPGRGRPDRRRGPHLPRRGPRLPLVRARPGRAPGRCRRWRRRRPGRAGPGRPRSRPSPDRAAPGRPPSWKCRLPQCGRPP